MGRCRFLLSRDIGTTAINWTKDHRQREERGTSVDLVDFTGPASALVLILRPRVEHE